MPKVPEYSSLQVTPQELPGVEQRTPQRLIQISDLGPGEMVRVGNQMQQAGSDFANIAIQQQATQNEAAVKDAHAAFLTTVNSVMNDPENGYMNQQGSTAVDNAPQVRDSLVQMQKSMMDNLPNEAQRRMFKQASDQTVLAAGAQVEQHASKQLEVYSQAASQARAGAGQNQAVQNYNPTVSIDDAANSMYRQGLTAQRIELEDQANKKGLADPDLRDQYIKFGPDGKSGIVSTYAGVVTNLLAQNNTQGAQAYFDQVKGDMPVEMQDKLGGYLKTASDADQGLKLALDVKGQAPDIGKQEDILDQMFKDGKIDAKVHGIALQQLRADTAQQRSEQAENDKAVLGRVWDLKNKNPNAGIADLSRSDYAYIESRGLGQHVDSILNSDPATDNPRLFLDLMQQAHDDPVAFLQQDITKFYGQLSGAHQRQLETAYNSIDKQDAKGIAAGKLVQGTLKTVKADMLAAGMNLNPKPGTKDADALATFEAQLHDTIAASVDPTKPAAQQAEDARRAALGLLKDQSLSGTGWFGTSVGLTHKPVYQMTPEEKAKDWEVPDTDRLQIQQSLRRKGVPVTEANIQRTYKLGKGVK